MTGPLAMQTTAGHAQLTHAELRKVNVRNRQLPLALRLQAYADRGTAGPAPGRCGSRLQFAPDFPADTPRRFCNKRPVRHGTTCRGHNGTPARGPANPAYRTGEYSELMQEGSALWKGYHRTNTDADLLNCSEQLRYMDAEYRLLVEQALAGAGAGPESWLKVRQAVEETVAAARTKDMDGMVTGLRQLQALVDPAAAAVTLRSQIRELEDSRRRMVETQGRLLERGGHLVPMDQTIRYGAVISQLAVNAMLNAKDLRHALSIFQQGLHALESGRTLEEAEVVTP